VRWPSGLENGNIGNNGYVVVVPPALSTQFLAECRRYLQPQSFDLLTYSGTHPKRGDWWRTVYAASRHAESRRIVVAVTPVSVDLIHIIINILDQHFILQALVSDSSVAFAHQARNSLSVAEMPERARNWETVGKVSTIYGKAWTLAIMDEAHGFRKVNQSYRSALALRGTAQSFVAMTATPVQTRPAVSSYIVLINHLASLLIN